jgi:hypothetical protein
MLARLVANLAEVDLEYLDGTRAEFSTECGANP